MRATGNREFTATTSESHYPLPDTGHRLPYGHNRSATQLVPRACDGARPAFEQLFGRALAERILTEEGIAEWACSLYLLGDCHRMQLPGLPAGQPLEVTAMTEFSIGHHCTGPRYHGPDHDGSLVTAGNTIGEHHHHTRYPAEAGLRPDRTSGQ